MKKKIKKILADCVSYDTIHKLSIPKLKNYEGRLTITKIYLYAVEK